MIAKKALGAGSTPTHADENLVCIAVANALVTGRDAIILSKDEDIQEQLFKMTTLLELNYSSHLLAQAYVRDPARFDPRPLDLDRPALQEAFDGSGSNVTIEASEDQVRSLATPDPHSVGFSSWTVGATLSTFAYGGEQEMLDVLTTKASSGGKNTALLGDQNCHYNLWPLDVPRKIRMRGAVVLDRTVPLGSTGLDVSVLDVAQALSADEPVSLL